MSFYRRSKFGFDFLIRNKNQIQNPIGIAHRRSSHTSFSQTIQKFSKSVPKSANKKLPIWKLYSRMLGLGVIVYGGDYYMFSETIPYSNRTHIIFLTHIQERMLGEMRSKDMKEKEKILSEDDPQSIRVRLIAKNILDSVQCGLGDRIVVQSNALQSGLDSDKSKMMKKEGEKKKIRGNIEHMEVFDWEFLVVEDSAYFQSGCLPGGKIHICTGDLSLCENDAEIASILGHEIGHAMARHVAEKMSKLSPILYLASPFKSIEEVINYRLVNPLLRKFAFEADYIGLLLMASAGYDPRVTLSFWKKVMEKLRDTSKTQVVTVASSHPSVEERLEMLSRPEVMEEALRLYQERINSNRLPKKD